MDDKIFNNNYRVNKNKFKEEIQQTFLVWEFWTKMIGKRNEKVELSDIAADINPQQE